MQIAADSLHEDFPEKDLSYRLVGCFYKVRNQYGRFHNERIYDRGLNEELHLATLSFVDKPRIPVYSVTTGEQLGVYIPDKLVESKILIELKARSFIPREEYQKAVEYLHVSVYEILYVVNFGEEQFQPKRFVYSNTRKKFLLSSKKSA